MLGGWLTSKPTWWNAFGCSTTSAFFVFGLIARRIRFDKIGTEGRGTFRRATSHNQTADRWWQESWSESQKNMQIFSLRWRTWLVKQTCLRTEIAFTGRAVQRRTTGSPCPSSRSQSPGRHPARSQPPAGPVGPERGHLNAFNRATLAVNPNRRITPAAEWLLDNFYLIEEQIQMARRHLPRGYSRELPRLAERPFRRTAARLRHRARTDLARGCTD